MTNVCHLPNKLINVRLKQVPGWSDYYVGENGTAWSNKDGRSLRELRGRSNNPSKGYKLITLYEKGRAKKGVLLHRLVWSAFVEDIIEESNRMVLHVDGDSFNHALCNLYCPPKGEGYFYNNADTSRHSHRHKTQKRKLSDQDVMDIKRRVSLGNVNRAAIAREYGVSKTFVDGIFWGKRYKRFTAYDQCPLPNITSFSDERSLSLLKSLREEGTDKRVLFV